MDYFRKLKLILAIECKLTELDTSYTYQDVEFNHHEYDESVVCDICTELGIDYNKYGYRTIRHLERELVENIIGDF